MSLSAPVNRRSALAAVIAGGALGAGLMQAEQAAALTLQGDPLKTWLKLYADLSGRTTFALARGYVWGFLPQGDDVSLQAFRKRLYGYQSLTARQAVTKPGGSVVLKTKGWTFYTDPDTDAVITELLNPYTGKIVKSAPMSGAASEQIVGQALGPGQDGPFGEMRIQTVGGHAFVSSAKFARFQTGGISWFKLEGDLTDYACSAADLTNAALTHIPSTWSHNIVAEWQTWMNMHGDPGHILFKGNGAHIGDGDKIPADVRQAVDTHFPNTLSPVLAWND